jgi:ketosteroid isomerase-like protein
MKAFRCTTGLAFAVALSAGCVEPQNLAEKTEAVRAVEVAFARTMADRDPEAFRSFLSDDAIFFNGDTPIRGAAAVAAAWAGFFEGPDAPFSWGPDLTEVLDSGELALSSGPVLNPAGEQVGRFNSVWRLESDGVWRIVFDKGS